MTNGFAAGTPVYGSRWTVTSNGTYAPVIAPQFDSVTVTVRDLIAMIEANANALSDYSQLRTLLNGTLQEEMARIEDANLMYGSGSNNQFSGILTNASNVNWSSMDLGTTMVDAIVQRYATLFARGVKPNAILMDITTYYNTAFDGSIPAILKVPCEPMLEIPDNTVVIGDFKTCKIFDREQITFEVGTVGNQMALRQRSVIAYERLAFGIANVDALAKLTFNSAPTA
jgi:hypothetical protein